MGRNCFVTGLAVIGVLAILACILILVAGIWIWQSAESPVPVTSTIPVTPTVTQDVSILNEGKYTPTTVPYASLVSTWLDLTKRNPQLMLCLDPKGCVVAARGDYRTYVYEDKTPIPEDVLRTWIVSQVGYFPHAKSLVDHKGVVIWP